MEPGSDNEPDLSVRTSVAKHSLRFNTSIVKKKEKKMKERKKKKREKMNVITHILETARGYRP